MMTRLTIVTTLIALFGVGMSYLAQKAPMESGSTVASAGGGNCDYTAGLVCQIERGKRGPTLNF
ncbi:hypothetical protein [Jiella sp. M17.18]|uniref:hypothetical protein n=1 Tax=Jiella sp. M17.18 TaxID=3234247 RepID=UPI0034DF5617